MFPIHASVRGHVRWCVLGEDGTLEVPRSPSGRPLAAAEGVLQPNLITDAGMNYIAVSSPFNTLTGAGNASTMRNTLAVGTGSTAPNVSDVALDNEVQSDNTSGAHSVGGTTCGLDTSANVWTAASHVNRIVTMTEQRNLTEFGLRAAGSSIFVRELLRDTGGVPITVTIPTGKSILVTHTFEIEMPAPAAGHSGTIDIEEYDISDVLVDTLSYGAVWGFWQGSTGGDVNRRVRDLFGVWDPSVTTTGSSQGRGVDAIKNDISYQRLVPSGWLTDNRRLSQSLPMQLEDYVAGSFERVKYGVFPPGSANGNSYGYIMADTMTGATNPDFFSGFVLILDSPTAYDKAATDELRFGLRSTWARA